MKREEFEARKKAAEEAKASKLRNAPKKLYVKPKNEFYVALFPRDYDYTGRVQTKIYLIFHFCITSQSEKTLSGCF